MRVERFIQDSVKMHRKGLMTGSIRLSILLLILFFLLACSSPNHLKQITSYPEQTQNEFQLFDFREIVTEGDYLYIANGIHGLTILDVSNPTESEAVNPNNLVNLGLGIVVEGNYAYVIDGDELKIIDVSNIEAPDIVNSYYVSPLYAIDMQPPYVYLITSQGKLQIIDITDPTNLKEVGVYQSENSIEDVIISRQYAYIIGADSQNHNFIEIVDISDSTTPIQKSITPVDLAMGVAIREDFVFVVNGDLQIFDASDPTSLKLISTYETPNIADRIKVKGNTVYIGDVFGAEIVDISDIYSPRRAGHYEDGNVKDIARVGDFVYVADIKKGLLIFEHP